MNHQYSLKSNQEISQIVKSKNRVGNKYFVVYFQNDEQFKVAFSVKKDIKAIKRNYLKRIAREVVRKNIETFKGHILVVIKKEALTISFEEFSFQLMNLINKIYRRQNAVN